MLTLHTHFFVTLITGSLCRADRLLPRNQLHITAALIGPCANTHHHPLYAMAAMFVVRKYVVKLLRSLLGERKVCMA